MIIKEKFIVKKLATNIASNIFTWKHLIKLSHLFFATWGRGNVRVVEGIISLDGYCWWRILLICKWWKKWKFKIISMDSMVKVYNVCCGNSKVSVLIMIQNINETLQKILKKWCVNKAKKFKIRRLFLYTFFYIAFKTVFQVVRAGNIMLTLDRSPSIFSFRLHLKLIN